jgi:hypothetical protein
MQHQAQRRSLPGPHSPEARLLFLAAGQESNDAEIRRLLDRPVDWTMLSRMALCEGAAGILYRRLRQLSSDRARTDIEQHLKPLGLVSQFQLAMLEQQFERLLAALESARIPVVLLKGAGLARSVYSGFAERPMTDVDLLVDADSAKRAYAIADGLGWVHRGDISVDRDYNTHQHLPPLEDKFRIGVGLELHTELFVRDGPFRFTADDLRSRARPLAAPGLAGDVSVPDLHDQLLHACLHFVWSHEMRFGAWRTFRDIDRIVAMKQLRWDEFLHRARDSRGASCCYWALELGRTLAKTPVPPEVLTALRPSGIRTIHSALRRHLVMQLVQSEQACPSAGLARAAWRMAVQPRRHGHGAVLPWNLVAAREAPSGTRGVAGWSRWRKAGRLAYYVSAVVVPAITGS